MHIIYVVPGAVCSCGEYFPALTPEHALAKAMRHARGKPGTQVLNYLHRTPNLKPAKPMELPKPESTPENVVDMQKYKKGKKS